MTDRQTRQLGIGSIRVPAQQVGRRRLLIGAGTRWLGALLAIAGLLAGMAGIGVHRAAANPCPVDRPCITHLYVDGGALNARWSIDWDFYNIEVSSPGVQTVKNYDYEGKSWGFTIADTGWNRTYTVSIQGCDRRFLAPSECSPWASQDVYVALPYGPDTCTEGFVWRDAYPDDHVCVTPETRAQAAADNAQAAARRSPNGGPYGPDTCLQGYVWREAFDGDTVCVTPEVRTQTADDNAQANQRRVVPR